VKQKKVVLRKTKPYKVTFGKNFGLVVKADGS
jgi:hypothetical protein